SKCSNIIRIRTNNCIVGVYAFIAYMIRKSIRILVAYPNIEILPSMVTFILGKVENNPCMVYTKYAFILADAVSKICAFIGCIVVVERDRYVGLSEESQPGRVSCNGTDIAA